MTREQLAKIAFHQISVKVPSMPEDFIHMAETFVDMAYKYLRDNSTYNPELIGEGAADLAIISYVKIMLVGESPEVSPEFKNAFGMWLKAAAREHYNETNYEWEAVKGNNINDKDNERVSRLRNFAHPRKHGS